MNTWMWALVAVCALAQVALIHAEGDCESNWEYYDSSCYRFFRGEVSWLEAKMACKNIKSNLVSIHTKAENDFLVREMSNRYIGQAWTGGSLDTASHLSWESGDPPSDSWSNWYRELNLAQHSLSKVLLYRHEGLWLAKPGESYRRPYICERQCESNWEYHNSSCYRFFSEEVSWLEAKMACKIIKSNLVSIHTEAENDFLLREMSNRYIGQAWTGGSLDTAAHLSWESGDPPSDSWSNWLRELNPAQHSSYKVMLYQYGGWRATPGESYRRSYICERQCRTNWEYHNSSCYRFYSSPANWNDAKLECLHAGSNLVSIHTEAENDFLATMLRTHGGMEGAWTGGVLDTAGHLSWQSREPPADSVAKWSNEPQPTSKANLRMKIGIAPNDQLEWITTVQTYSSYFICERPTVLPARDCFTVVNNTHARGADRHAVLVDLEECLALCLRIGCKSVEWDPNYRLYKFINCWTFSSSRRVHAVETKAGVDHFTYIEGKKCL